ncbi:putative aldouronate transport system permease protein [Cohnella sp. OV330]|uniref:carbohydrate ABC transporter permease n=1 Tax=Cohnella sp. OV330 TaxID=1855288 RepID=UPI0008F08B27|nr:carbohydrate ABC transporter permease [Cohnella sp. OV330]SFB56402.1 putative aldouronate transport system permease protein [Cohnella sp. OV330]
MKIKHTLDIKIFNAISYTVVGFLGIVTLLPFVVLLASSFSSEASIIREGYSLIPRDFSLQAYSLVFKEPDEILRAYAMTISLTMIGTVVALFFSAMTAYVLYRKEVKHRNKLSFFLYFTTLFNGGLASFYITVNNHLHLKNTFLVLLLVHMFSVVYILMLRSFMQGSLHDSILESAKIDGAGDFMMFVRIVLPLMKPALATIGLFTALGYWNDWWTPMLFIENDKLFPLQYVLYRVLSNVEMAASIIKAPIAVELPKETLKLALTVVSTGPIVLLYPFMQKYFVKGITVGAVKG